MADTEERQMLPEVQAYLTARAEAETTQREAEQALYAKYPDRYGYSAENRQQRDAFYAESEEIVTKHRVARNEAWNALKGSSEPLVRWIAEHCKDYQSEALVVLRALPATLDELDELADRQDFCHIWNQFRDQAAEEGLFGEIRKPSEARKAMNRWLNEEYGMGRGSVIRLNRLVDTVVSEESAKAAA